MVVVACCFVTLRNGLTFNYKKWNIAKWKGNRFWYDYAKVRILHSKEYQEFKLQEEPLKQEPPADTRGGFLIFCASAGLFIAVRLYFG